MMSIVSSNVKGCSSDPRAAADTIIEELVSVFSHRFPRLFSLHVEISAKLIDCVSIRLCGLADGRVIYFFFQLPNGIG